MNVGSFLEQKASRGFQKFHPHGQVRMQDQLPNLQGCMQMKTWGSSFQRQGKHQKEASQTWESWKETEKAPGMGLAEGVLPWAGRDTLG